MDKKALGKGLGALIPERQADEIGGIAEIDTGSISPNPHQPRREFHREGLDELVESIRRDGVLEPVLVRKVDGHYELIAGGRRLLAAREAGLTKIPAIIKSVTESQMLELSLVENVQRSDLNPVEEARAYKELVEKFDFTQEKIASAIGKKRSSIANTLRLLELPEEIQNAMSQALLSRGHGLVILSLNKHSDRMMLFHEIMRHALSVRGAEQFARKLTSPRRAPRQAEESPLTASIQEKLQHLFGTRVYIRQTGKRGRIEIDYHSDEDLDRILKILKVSL